MNKIRKKIEDFKKELLNQLKEFFDKRGVESIHTAEVYPGSDASPVVIRGNDDWDTYTLDNVVLRQRDGFWKFIFEASSSDDSAEVTSDHIDIETLAGIIEWFEDYEENIDEYLEEEKENS